MTDPLSTIVEREVTEALEFFDLPELLAIALELANTDEPLQPPDPFTDHEDCIFCDNFTGHEPDCLWVRAKRWVDTNLTRAQTELNR